MSESVKIAKKTIDDKINNGESFSFEEIQKEIIKNKGILYMGADYSVGDYLVDLEKANVIAFDSYTNRFFVLKSA